MRPDEITSLINSNILENLNQEIDVGLQAEALKAFNNLIETEDVPVDLKRKIIPFLEKEMKQQDSHIRTDIFNTLARLGMQNFELIKPLLPEIMDELLKKNRFRAKIVIKLIGNLAPSPISEVEAAIRKILTDGTVWFQDPSMIPIFEDFFKIVTSRGNAFVKKYRKEIEDLLIKLPPSMKNIDKILSSKLDDYEKFLKAEEQRKLDEEKKRKELEAEKERLRKEREEERLKRKEQRDSVINVLTEETGKQGPDNEPAQESEEEDESSRFRTFTDYRLQRKQVKKPEETDSDS